MTNLENFEPDGAFVLPAQGTIISGSSAGWNASAACCDEDATGVDDSAYLRSLLDQVMSSQVSPWPIDENRVFVVGYSNGGFMAYRMACDHDDVVTGIAVLSGAGQAVTDPACAATVPVSVLHSHGDSDSTVQWGGGTIPGLTMDAHPSATPSLDAWKTLSGASGSLSTHSTADYFSDLGGSETDKRTYTTEPANGEGYLEMWEMNGRGHDMTLLDSSWGTDVFSWLYAHPRVP